MKPHYSYHPLHTKSSIRVIRLVEDTSEAWLHFDITEIDINEASCPPYRCLSYTWGCPYGDERDSTSQVSGPWNEQHEILLSEQGQAESHSLTVTTNLRQFLQEWRSTNPEDLKWTWIDAICINQSDAREREAQVNLMGQIYNSCHEVIIWLGGEGKETRYIFYTMNTIGKIPSDTWRDLLDAVELMPSQIANVKSADEDTKRIFNGLTKLELRYPGAHERQAIILFFNRSYFHRVWTVHEQTRSLEIRKSDAIILQTSFRGK